jgi:hypothetical protein
MLEDLNPEAGKLVVVHNVRNQIEGAIVEGALKDEGIPAMVDYGTDAAFDGIAAVRSRWGRVTVREGDAERAREVIAEALAEQRLDEDADLPPEAGETDKQEG